MASKLLSASVVAGCLLFVGCQSMDGAPDKDDGYFTWVDEQGRVRQTAIPRKSLEEAVSEPRPAREENTGRNVAASGEAGKSAGEQAGPPSDAEFNLQNYPDGNELEKAGFIRPGDPMPYFTWTDASGNVRVSYFTPDTRSDVEKGLIRPPVRLTPASTYRPDSQAGSSSDIYAADSDTLAILGVEQEGMPWFERWASHCCNGLPPANPREWQEDREFSVRIGQDAPRHEFITGTSAYRLVQLPSPSSYQDFVVRLRSFADQERLFVPSVAFLDSSLRPLRVVTDLAHEFVPENWSRQAYLQAFIPVFPGKGERWMLIFTRHQDLDGQTVIEEKRRPVAFQHGQSGLLSVESVDID